MLSSILPFLLSNDATLPATRSLKASSFMASSNTVACIELRQISECMFDCYDDDGEWTVAYLLSRMKCGEATLPERLQIQSIAVDPYLYVEISAHNIETLALRLTSSVAFTLIMTSPYFITPTVAVVVLLVNDYDDDDDDDEKNDDEDR